MRAARLIIALVAIVVAAWLFIGARQSHELAQATAIVSAPKLTAADAHRATSLLRSAATLNPDRQVTQVKGQLAERRRQLRRALAIALSQTRAEPMNVDAWYQLAQYAGALHDKSLLRRGLVQIRALAPPVH